MTRASPKILIIILLFVLPASLFSQSNIKLGNRFGDNWFLGATAGPTFFSGDLNANRIMPHAGDWRVAGSFFAGRQFSPVFALRTQFLIGKTAGTKLKDEEGDLLNLRFDAFLLEGNVNTMINFSNLIGGVNSKRVFFLYGTLGMGGTGWKTTIRNTVTNEEVINNASHWKGAAVFPVGLGGYFSIANKVNLGLEWTFRPTTSDLVDGTTGGFKIDIYSYLALGITLNLNPPTRKMPDIVEYRKEGPIILNLPKCQPVPAPTAENRLGTMDKLSPPPSLLPGVGEDYLYKVQIFAFGQHIYAPETIRKRYHIPMPVSREYSDGLYRFTVGSTKNLNEALDICNRMKEAGIRDAFIVAYNKEGQRVPFSPSW